MGTLTPSRCSSQTSGIPLEFSFKNILVGLKRSIALHSYADFKDGKKTFKRVKQWFEGGKSFPCSARLAGSFVQPQSYTLQLSPPLWLALRIGWLLCLEWLFLGEIVSDENMLGGLDRALPCRC